MNVYYSPNVKEICFQYLKKNTLYFVRLKGTAWMMRNKLMTKKGYSEFISLNDKKIGQIL